MLRVNEDHERDEYKVELSAADKASNADAE
jgi:hypothetical protein